MVMNLILICMKDQILERYPCIKENIENDKEKIYHLPFDQQYDTTKIESDKGESYFMTVKEAEDNGFRRAKRWMGNKTGDG